MIDSQKIIIAIDGYSSCGKSTLAKDLASHLSYKYLDSGAMYRAVCLYCIRHEIDVHNREAVRKALPQINITFEVLDRQNITLLNGVNVEQEIRSMEVSSKVSEVSVIPEVRHAMVQLQKKMGKDKGIVIDGRDITSVVFPEAELKIFVTADVSVRAQRRFLELKSKGKDITIEKVTENLLHRDTIDTSRSHSPLIRVPDAFLIDNTYLNRSEQLQVALRFRDHVLMEISG